MAATLKQTRKGISAINQSVGIVSLETTGRQDAVKLTASFMDVGREGLISPISHHHLKRMAEEMEDIYIKYYNKIFED